MCIAAVRVSLETILSEIFGVEVPVPAIDLNPNPNPTREVEVCGSFSYGVHRAISTVNLFLAIRPCHDNPALVETRVEVDRKTLDLVLRVSEADKRSGRCGRT